MEITKSLQLGTEILQMVSGESSALNITVQWFVVPRYIYEIPGFMYPEPLSRFPELLQENTKFIILNYPTVTSLHTFPILYSIISPSFDAISFLSMNMILNKTIINKIRI